MEKKTKQDSIPHFVLPSDNNELESFTLKNKPQMMEQVVNAIEYAFKYNMSTVDVFQFKNSDFVITVNEKDFLQNLDNIYKHYIKNEIYERCKRIITLQSKIKNQIPISTSNEKKK